MFIIKAFFIIDCFMDPPMLLFVKLEKKIEILFFIPSYPNNSLNGLEILKTVYLYLKAQYIHKFLRGCKRAAP